MTIEETLADINKLIERAPDKIKSAVAAALTALDPTDVSSVIKYETCIRHNFYHDYPTYKKLREIGAKYLGPQR